MRAATITLVAVVTAAGADASCVRDCGVFARRCRQDARKVTRVQERLCDTIFDRARGRCLGTLSAAGCNGYTSPGACRRDQRAFGRSIRSRCIPARSACQACCAGGRPGAECARSPSCPAPPGGTTLRVDTADGGVALGDGRLSLAEAILVANGEVTPAALDALERGQITGSPGRGSADTITFALPRGLTVRAPLARAAVAAFPALTGGGDIVDGCGLVQIDGSALPRTSQLSGIALGSSGNEIRGLTLTGFPVAGVFVFTSAGGTVAGNRVRSCTLRNNAAAGVLATGALPGLGAGSVIGTEIRGNHFSRNLLAVNVLGATAVAGTSVVGGLVADTVVTDNHIEDQQEGIFALGAVAAGAGSVRGGRVTRITVAGNVLRHVLDVGVALLGGQASDGGEVFDSSVSGALVAGTDVVGVGTALFVAGGMAFTDGTAERNAVLDATLADNVATAAATAVLANAGYAERGLIGRVLGNRLARLLVVRQRATDVDAGVFLSAGQTFVTGVPVLDNVVEDVEIADGTFEGSGTGIAVAGATATEPVCARNATFFPVGLPGENAAAEVSGNVARRIRLHGNLIRPHTVGVLVSAGQACRSSDVVRANRVHEVTLAGNRIEDAGAGGVIASGGIATGPAATSGGSIDGLAIDSNSVRRSRSFGVAVVGASTVEGGVNTGNAVRDTRIRDNLIAETTALAGGGAGDGIVVSGDPANPVTGGVIAGNQLFENTGETIVVSGASDFEVVP